MSPEAQRIAIAEACGIREYPDFGLRDSRMVQVASSWDEWDPLNDLNAMHEAEKVLHGNKWRPYHTELAKINCHWDCGSYPAIDCTAAQRAEAFLRTIGKWEGEK